MGRSTRTRRAAVRACLALPLLMAPVLSACADTTASRSSGEFDRTASLRVAQRFVALTMDPAVQYGPQLGTLYPVYDRLIRYNEDGKLEPMLATQWKFTDPMTLEMTLREGVLFHDGAEFNASAVVKNIERSRTLENASDTVKDVVRSIESVEAVAPYKVRFQFSEPSYSIILDLASGLGMMISPQALTNADLDVHPVGSGPYELVDFRPDESAVFRRYDGYWDRNAAGVAELEINFVADSETRLNGLESGQFDLSYIDPDQVQAAKSRGLRIIDSGPIDLFQNIYTDIRSNGPLADVRVRRAINYAIDRQGLVEGVYAGFGVPVQQLFIPGNAAYSATYAPGYYPYDLDKARNLLAEAEYPDGFALDAITTTGTSGIRLGEAVASMLSKVNIKLNLLPVDPTGIGRFQGGEFPNSLMIVQWADVTAAADGQDTFAAVVGPEGRNNPGGYTTDKIVGLLREIEGQEVGSESRAKLLQAASGEMVDQALVMPLLAQSETWATNDCVSGFDIYQTSVNEFRGVQMKSGCE